MGENERISVCLSSLISKMDANKITESFPTYRILTFVSNFESENAIDWPRLGDLISLQYILSMEEDKNTKVRGFWLILRAKTLFFKKRSKSARQTNFFKMRQNSSI